MSTRVVLIAVLGLLGLASVRWTPVAQAANFSPTSTAELIAAINDANGNISDDVIHLSPGQTYTLTSAYGTAGLPDITSDITIIGNGATITRDPNASAFRIAYVASSGALTLENVTISNGNVTINNNGSPDHAGGIFNEGGDLTVVDSRFTGNHADGVGGAIFTANGNLTVRNSVFSGNTAGSGGAAIDGLASLMRVEASTITDNHAVTAGGGIYVSAGSLQLTDSTLAGNTAGSFGGGAITTYAGTVIATNSTISGNTAGRGGGIRTFGGSLSLSNVTISDNTATIQGGGIYNEDATMALDNSIVAANSAPSGVDLWFVNAIPTGSYNLIGDGSTALAFVNGVNGNQVGSAADPLDPYLGPLADNGGSTLTMMPQIGSPAIDAANDTIAPASDQRGFARPFGPDSDIGAVEFTVTYDDLCDLTRQYVTRASAADAACATLATAEMAEQQGNGIIRQLALAQYALQIRSAVKSRYVSNAQGAELISYANQILRYN
jgi:hypothetical protein